MRILRSSGCFMGGTFKARHAVVCGMTCATKLPCCMQRSCMHGRRILEHLLAVSLQVPFSRCGPTAGFSLQDPSSCPGALPLRAAHFMPGLPRTPSFFWLPFPLSIHKYSRFSPSAGILAPNKPWPAPSRPPVSPRVARLPGSSWPPRCVQTCALRTDAM